MFVTKNPVLCEAVQKNFQELCHAEPVAERHTAVEEEPLPHRLQVTYLHDFAIIYDSRPLDMLIFGYCK